MRVSRLALAATTLSLATAAPAAAVNGLGVSSALRHANRVAVTGPAQTRKTAHTCQAGSTKKKAVPARSALVGDPRKHAVVACEQPPRSQLVTLQAFKQAAAAALAAFG